MIESKIVYDKIEGGKRYVIILFNDGHYSSYVGVPKDNPFYGLDWQDNRLMKAGMGCVTYSEENLPVTTMDDFWYIGMDYADTYHHIDLPTLFRVYTEEEAIAIIARFNWKLGYPYTHLDKVIEEVRALGQNLN